jgi:hypothetical protein
MHNYSGTSYTFARNIAVVGGSFATGVGETSMIQAMISSQKAQGVDKPKWVASDAAVSRFFQNSKVPMQQIILNNSANGISTSGEIAFMGMPWVWDVAYPNSTTALLLNPDYVKIYTKGNAMSFGKPMEVVDQWFMAWKMKMRLQVMFLNLARQAVVSSLAA